MPVPTPIMDTQSEQEQAQAQAVTVGRSGSLMVDGSANEDANENGNGSGHANRNGGGSSSRSRKTSAAGGNKPKKEFKCPDCDKVFARKEFVERHRRLQHLDERPFACTECEASFSRTDLLKRHTKTCPARRAAQALAANGGVGNGVGENGVGEIKKRRRRKVNGTGGSAAAAENGDKAKGKGCKKAGNGTGAGSSNTNGTATTLNGVQGHGPKTNGSAGPSNSQSTPEDPLTTSSVEETPTTDTNNNRIPFFDQTSHTSGYPYNAAFSSNGAGIFFSSQGLNGIGIGGGMDLDYDPTMTISMSMAGLPNIIDSSNDSPHSGPSGLAGTPMPADSPGASSIFAADVFNDLLSNPANTQFFPKTPATSGGTLGENGMNYDEAESLMSFLAGNSVIGGGTFGYPNGTSPQSDSSGSGSNSGTGSGSNSNPSPSTFPSGIRILPDRSKELVNPGLSGITLGDLNLTSTAPRMQMRSNGLADPNMLNGGFGTAEEVANWPGFGGNGNISHNNNNNGGSDSSPNSNNSSFEAILDTSLSELYSVPGGGGPGRDAQTVEAVRSHANERPRPSAPRGEGSGDGQSQGRQSGFFSWDKWLQEAGLEVGNEDEEAQDNRQTQHQGQKRARGDEEDGGTERRGEQHRRALSPRVDKRMNNWVPPHAYAQKDKNVTGRFYIPPERFLKAYAFHAWAIPPLQVLSSYARLAATSFLPNIPIVHSGSLRMAQICTHLAYALSVAGATYSRTPQGEEFGDKMLVEKRVYILRDFSTQGSTFEEKFAIIQAFLVYQLLGLAHRDRAHRMLGQTFHGSVVMMMRQLDLAELVRTADPDTQPPTTPCTPMELVSRWEAWIKVETWRRAVFLVWLSDLECAIRFDQVPLLPMSEVDVNLPSSDELWNAPDAESWGKLAGEYPQKPVTFMQTIQLLLGEEWDRENPPIPSFGTFTFLVVSRSLAFLRKWVQTSLHKRPVPSNNLFWAFAGLQDTDVDHLGQALAKVNRALDRLPTIKSSGKGREWGMKDRWLDVVIPTSGLAFMDALHQCPLIKTANNPQ